MSPEGRTLADEEPKPEKKAEKPAPPRVRIKATEEGARVVAQAKTIESRPAREAPKREERPARAKEESSDRPPIEDSPSVAVAETKRAKPAEEATGSGKPPPPHIARGDKPAPPRRHTAPREDAAPAGPAKVRVSEVAPAPRAEPAEASVSVSGEAPAAPAPATAAKAGSEAPHIHTDAGRHSALTSAIGVVLIVFLVELGAGVASNSLALFSDAGHTFMDLFSYGIAFAAVTVSQRRSSERETFGGHRAEIVAAFVSGVLLLIVVVVIYLEAFSRAVNPEPGNLSYMLTVPFLAIAANLYLARRFAGAKDLNMRGARMHVLSDLLSAIGVLGGGLLILATGNWIFDPLAAGFVGLLILIGALQLLRESAEILLERAPAHLPVNDLIVKLKALPGVEGVHAVHAWSLCSTVHALSAHIVAPSATPAEAERLLLSVKEMAEKDFQIQFTTVQVEHKPCGAEQHPTVPHTAAEVLAHGHSHA